MKRKIVWLGVSWLIVAALVLTSCGSTVPVGEEEEEEEVTPPVEEEPEGFVTLSLGETYQTSEVTVTVSEVSLVDSFEYTDAIGKITVVMEAEPDESFLIASIAVENLSNVLLEMETKRHFRVSDSNGNEYIVPHPIGEGRLPNFTYIRQDKTLEGTALFEVPKTASGLKVEFWKFILVIKGEGGQKAEKEFEKKAEWVVE